MGVLAHLLPVIGTLIGPRLYFESDDRQPPRINTVLVGPTNAGRKGTSFVPVNRLMETFDPDGWAQQHISGLSSGEGLIVGVDQAPGKRLYVKEPEFSRVFASKGREGNTLSMLIRQAFDDGNLHTMTVEPKHARGAHVSITGHITEEELQHCLTAIDRVNGFGNRFLWFVVKSDKVLPNPKPIPDSVFNLLIPQLHALQARQDIDSPVKMDWQARILWKRAYVDRLRWDQPGLGLAQTMVSRGASMVLRVSLIYAAIDAPEKPVIRLPHLKAALAVWDYCEDSAYQLFGGKSDSRCGEKILKLLRESGSMTTTEMNRHLSPGQKAAATPALEELEKQGLIRSRKEKTGGRGRPTIMWELVRD